MLLTLHGRTILIKRLEEDDIPKLLIFCDKCKDIGLENNKDFVAIKLVEMVMPYGQFFIAIDVKSDIIFSLAGVHYLPEIGPNAWRCLFRGAQLPGYVPKWSMNIFESGIHFTYFLYEQIKFIQSIDDHAEFYISTNVDNKKAGSSSRLNKTMMPRLANLGYIDLYKENFELYYTLQNVWKINIDNYFKSRAEYADVIAS